MMLGMNNGIIRGMGYSTLSNIKEVKEKIAMGWNWKEKSSQEVDNY